MNSEIKEQQYGFYLQYIKSWNSLHPLTSKNSENVLIENSL